MSKYIEHKQFLIKLAKLMNDSNIELSTGGVCENGYTISIINNINQEEVEIYPHSGSENFTADHILEEAKGL